MSRLDNGFIGLALVLLLVGELGAAPPLTTIDDTLYKADGTLFEGVLLINWKSFEGPGTTNVPTNSVRVTVRNGRLYTRLVPTTTAPTAAYYSVRYVAAGNVQFTELWSVPSSETALRVRDVRIDWPPATTAIVAPATDIAIVDVDGLTEALDIRPTKGQSYAPSRAAVIGPAGDVEAAAGDPTDCIRVDGTSGPCGSTAPGGGFIDGETPAGTIDGTNSTFAVSVDPNPASSLLLYRNGLLQKQGLDYSVAGNVISFLANSTPQPGDALLASYRTAAETTTSFGFADGETPAGTVDGANATFTLAGSPNPATSLLLYRNGLLQKQDFDYTLSGNIVTFLTGAVPQPGDVITASYRTAGI